MKQRLHIAKTLIHDPAVVILDEPTIGLDPGAAIEVRELIAALVPDHTVLLTTHDMHEADVLCSEIAIVDQGRIVAQGSPAALKAESGVERGVTIALDGPIPAGLETIQGALAAIPGVIQASITLDPDARPLITLTCSDTSSVLDGALALVRENEARVAAIDIREPSLEDAFLRATGHQFDAASATDEGENA
jgi:ABC-2 type transport system ATP-binding protein